MFARSRARHSLNRPLKLIHLPSGDGSSVTSSVAVGHDVSSGKGVM